MYLHNEFSSASAAPNAYVMDNEISQELIETLVQNNTSYQLVPPHIHRRNLVERDIKTHKIHLKAILSSVDPAFPLTELDRLIEQCNTTLNLVSFARNNPLLSAYTYIFGEFNFGATPLPPPGSNILAYVKPNVRRTWELNGELGWDVSHSMKHYRCVEYYFPRTKTTRDCDTVNFFPKSIHFPEIK